MRRSTGLAGLSAVFPGKQACICGAVAAVAALTAGCAEQRPRQSAWQPTAALVERAPTLPTVPGQPPASPPTYTATGEVPMTTGGYKIGKPYEVNGVQYVPAEDPRYDRIGGASWYGHDFHARRTANGEHFDMTRLTGAHPTLPLPSYVYVTNLRNGRTVIVRLNDRGPYKRGRIIDVSRRAALALGFESHGTTEVRVRYAGPAPLDPADDRRERQYLASQPWSRVVDTGGGGQSWSRTSGLAPSGTVR